MLSLNLSGNWLGSAPGGLPIRLWVGGETMVSIVLPKGAQTVTAQVATELGTANAHMAIFAAPSMSGGSDGLMIGSQVDLLGFNATTSVPQTISVSTPASTAAAPSAPAVYVARLWVDSINGTATGKARTNGGTADTLPVGVQLLSLAVT